MPRSMKPRPPSVRSDGQPVTGNLTSPGAQPNGRIPGGANAAALGAGGNEPYGQNTQLRQDLANTPVPPGIHPLAHAAHMALQNYHPNVTPLSAPTTRPWEPVTAGAPLDSGPTNPMAAAAPGPMGSTVADLLNAAASAGGSPTLRALANRATAVEGNGPGVVAQ